LNNSYGKVIKEFDRENRNYKLYSDEAAATFTVVVDGGDTVVGPMTAKEFVAKYIGFMATGKVP
jgi:hypothetical protein